MNIIKIIIAVLTITLQAVIGFGQLANLNNEEKDNLLLMLEEEKLARDVYYTLGEKWDLKVFNNIVSSEEKHLALVKDMVKQYSIEMPSEVKLDKVGVFENQHLQSLYNQLTTAGNTSIVSALKVGAKIEELDISDLEDAIANTENQELIDLYTPLRNASENHLRAFVKNLNSHDVAYEVEILDQNQFDKIISESNSNSNCKSGMTGKSDKGKGNSKCKGKGHRKGKKECCSAL